MAAVHRPVTKTAAPRVGIEPSMSGRIFIATATSGTQTFLLPKAFPNGQLYTVMANDAGGEILINPTASDSILFKASEGGASIAPAVGIGIKNTAGSNVVSDRITLVSDGGIAWYAIEQSGTWASQ
jgi:hypothetical protein